MVLGFSTGASFCGGGGGGGARFSSSISMFVIVGYLEFYASRTFVGKVH